MSKEIFERVHAEALRQHCHDNGINIADTETTTITTGVVKKARTFYNGKIIIEMQYINNELLNIQFNQ